jgi:hypothetical protein
MEKEKNTKPSYIIGFGSRKDFTKKIHDGDVTEKIYDHLNIKFYYHSQFEESPQPKDYSFTSNKPIEESKIISLENKDNSCILSTILLKKKVNFDLSKFDATIIKRIKNATEKNNELLFVVDFANSKEENPPIHHIKMPNQPAIAISSSIINTTHANQGYFFLTPGLIKILSGVAWAGLASLVYIYLIKKS